MLGACAQVNDMASAAAMMLLIKDQGCVPKRPSYVADLRDYQLQGNLTIADASLNTTRKGGSDLHNGMQK